MNGLYEISNYGNVRKINKDYRSPKYRYLKQAKQYNGYCRVILTKNKIKFTALIHRLVAKAFIPNPDNKPTVNHINGIKSDNCVKNLEWATFSENLQHSILVLARNRNTEKQRISAVKIGKSKRKLTLNQAKKIREEINTTTRKELANKYNVSLSVIDNIIKGKRYID